MGSRESVLLCDFFGWFGGRGDKRMEGKERREDDLYLLREVWKG